MQAAHIGPIHALKDRLDGHSIGRVGRTLTQALHDLFRAPPVGEQALHQSPHRFVAEQLADPRPSAARGGQTVGQERIRTGVKVTIAAQFPAHRCPVPSQLPSDGTDRVPRPTKVGNGYPLVLVQEPPRDPFDGGRDHRRIMQPPAITRPDCAAVSPPLARPPIDPDNPARLRVAHTPRDQRRELLPLRRLRRWPGTTSAHRNPSSGVATTPGIRRSPMPSRAWVCCARSAAALAP